MEPGREISATRDCEQAARHSKRCCDVVVLGVVCGNADPQCTDQRAPGRGCHLRHPQGRQQGRCACPRETRIGRLFLDAQFWLLETVIGVLCSNLCRRSFICAHHCVGVKSVGKCVGDELN